MYRIKTYKLEFNIEYSKSRPLDVDLSKSKPLYTEFNLHSRITDPKGGDIIRPQKIYSN